ncbi:MAG: hypothetical protein WC758_00715 [Candidatus Woesearchaeota archaeon]
MIQSSFFQEGNIGDVILKELHNSLEDNKNFKQIADDWFTRSVFSSNEFNYSLTSDGIKWIDKNNYLYSKSSEQYKYVLGNIILQSSDELLKAEFEKFLNLYVAQINEDREIPLTTFENELQKVRAMDNYFLDKGEIKKLRDESINFQNKPKYKRARVRGNFKSNGNSLRIGVASLSVVSAVVFAGYFALNIFKSDKQDIMINDTNSLAKEIYVVDFKTELPSKDALTSNNTSAKADSLKLESMSSASRTLSAINNESINKEIMLPKQIKGVDPINYFTFDSISASVLESNPIKPIAEFEQSSIIGKSSNMGVEQDSKKYVFNKINSQIDDYKLEDLIKAGNRGLTGILKYISPKAKPDYGVNGNISELAKLAGINLFAENPNWEHVRTSAYKNNGINDKLTKENIKKMYNKLTGKEPANKNELSANEYKSISNMYNSSNNKERTIDELADLLSIDVNKTKDAIVQSKDYAGVEYIRYSSSIKDAISLNDSALLVKTYLNNKVTDTVNIFSEKTDINLGSKFYVALDDMASRLGLGKIRKSKLNEVKRQELINTIDMYLSYV